MIVVDGIGMLVENVERQYTLIATKTGSRAMNSFALNAESKMTTKARLNHETIQMHRVRIVMHSKRSRQTESVSFRKGLKKSEMGVG